MNGGGRRMAEHGARNTSEGLKPLAVYHLVSCTGRGFQMALETRVGGWGGETQQNEGLGKALPVPVFHLSQCHISKQGMM